MASTPRMQAVRAERQQRIVDEARSIAERDGWPAVTVRRLADAIGYSQPVLYSHFPGGRDQIVGAVMVAGYAELGAELAAASDGSGAIDARGATGSTADGRLRAVVSAYLAFARAHPAVYEAMSSMPSSVAFAADETPDALREGFEQLRAVAGGSDDEARTVRAELLWSALHGISRLDADGRMDPRLDRARIDALVELFSA